MAEEATDDKKNYSYGEYLDVLQKEGRGEDAQKLVGYMESLDPNSRNVLALAQLSKDELEKAIKESPGAVEYDTGKSGNEVVQTIMKDGKAPPAPEKTDNPGQEQGTEGQKPEEQKPEQGQGTEGQKPEEQKPDTPEQGADKKKDEPAKDKEQELIDKLEKLKAKLEKGPEKYVGPGSKGITKGEDVETIQEAVKAMDPDADLGTTGKDGVDGDFGQKSYDAVKKMQEEKGLSKDGQVGKDTIDKMIEDLKEKQKAKAAEKDKDKTEGKDDKDKTEGKDDKDKTEGKDKPTQKDRQNSRHGKHDDKNEGKSDEGDKHYKVTAHQDIDYKKMAEKLGADDPEKLKDALKKAGISGDKIKAGESFEVDAGEQKMTAEEVKEASKDLEIGVKEVESHDAPASTPASANKQAGGKGM